MAAVVVLKATDTRGVEILDQMESITEQGGEHVDNRTRRYALLQPDADRDAFTPLLDEIAPEWRNHLANITGH